MSTGTGISIPALAASMRGESNSTATEWVSDPSTLEGQQEGAILVVKRLIDDNYLVGDFVRVIQQPIKTDDGHDNGMDSNTLMVENLRTKCFLTVDWATFFPIPYYGSCKCELGECRCIYETYTEYQKRSPHRALWRPHPACKPNGAEKVFGSTSLDAQRNGAILAVHQIAPCAGYRILGNQNEKPELLKVWKNGFIDKSLTLKARQKKLKARREARAKAKSKDDVNPDHSMMDFDETPQNETATASEDDDEEDIPRLDVDVDDLVEIRSFCKEHCEHVLGTSLRTKATGLISWKSFRNVGTREMCACPQFKCKCKYDDFEKSLKYSTELRS